LAITFHAAAESLLLLMISVKQSQWLARIWRLVSSQ
jgi:hypothetical protein